MTIFDFFGALWTGFLCGISFWFGQKYERRKIERDRQPVQRLESREPTFGDPPDVV